MGKEASSTGRRRLGSRLPPCVTRLNFQGVPGLFTQEPEAMPNAQTDQQKLMQIAAACQEAIQSQRQREARQGYGLDDYTEGRIVGAANLARKIMRIVSPTQADGST